jgi:hypothetical protein
MPEEVRGIAWEAYEHHHVEKKSDWYWVGGIIIASVSIASFFLGNPLFGILLIIGGSVIMILASRPPKIIQLAVTQRGLRLDDTLYPYTTLEAYFIDEENSVGPQLLVRSEKMFMPLLILPLPEEYVDDIEHIISQRLPEEHLEEPLARKILEFLGL